MDILGQQQRWLAGLRHLEVLRTMAILEYYGFLFAVALIWFFVIPDYWSIPAVLFCALRMATAHANARALADDLRVADKYMLYPFF